MMSSNKENFNVSIEQRQFTAKMTNRIRLRQLCRITKVFHDCIG